jgi:hypothetical protein
VCAVLKAVINMYMKFEITGKASVDDDVALGDVRCSYHLALIIEFLG